ncbi:hypothetical protein ACWELJ_25920 [Nocardia sp. NPDC004582]
MNTAAHLVADELAAAEYAYTRAVNGPSSAEEADARARLTVALEAAQALLRAIPAAGLEAATEFQPDDRVLWLCEFGDELHIQRGHIEREALRLSPHRRYLIRVDNRGTRQSVTHIVGAPNLLLAPEPTTETGSE